MGPMMSPVMSASESLAPTVCTRSKAFRFLMLTGDSSTMLLVIPNGQTRLSLGNEAVVMTPHYASELRNRQLKIT